MSDGTKLMLSCIIGLVLCTFAITSCVHYGDKIDNEAITEMVKHGADPIAAKCAVKGPDNLDCVVLAAKK